MGHRLLSLRPRRSTPRAKQQRVNRPRRDVLLDRSGRRCRRLPGQRHGPALDRPTTQYDLIVKRSSAEDDLPHGPPGKAKPTRRKRSPGRISSRPTDEGPPSRPRVVAVPPNYDEREHLRRNLGLLLPVVAGAEEGALGDMLNSSFGRPAFYPAGTKPKDFLSLYAERLPSVELNATSTASVGGAAADVGGADAGGFRFAVKMSRDHHTAARGVATFCERALAMGDRLGPISSSCRRASRATTVCCGCSSTRSTPGSATRSSSGTRAGRASTRRTCARRLVGGRRAVPLPAPPRAAVRRGSARAGRIGSGPCSTAGATSTRTSSTRTSRPRPRTRFVSKNSSLGLDGEALDRHDAESADVRRGRAGGGADDGRDAADIAGTLPPGLDLPGGASTSNV